MVGGDIIGWHTDRIIVVAGAMPDRLRFDGSWQRWLAFGFGSGLSPVAPGTVGTLVAVPVVWLLAMLPTTAYFICVAAVIATSMLVSHSVSRELGEKDHPAIVIDEIAGYLVTMALIPFTWWTVIAGFFIFRIFDILKPPPIGWLDRNCPGGFGITIDDLVAGIYANLALQGLIVVVGYV